ncbi:CBS domain-containing protein [Laspinema olomoucense]|uniref:histidine kinase n=1 Tax=Laspinema olomoucense D3b TaxID=2953688 RepID=A0ABT2NE30_9CYAN|nr:MULTISPECIES: CBS domain-containing protein [unclassified Laspinema]MCT7980807.1 CBS domain-containing protein [Laspinema sp. D3b]MCT7989273.1 CBS domain-containing protein [Laspinema sp. D3a]
MLQPNYLPFYSPDLEQAINRSPMVVSPDTPLIDVITQMAHARASCALTDVTVSMAFSPLDDVGDGCVLVMEGEQLRGIFSERDVVHLCAAGVKIVNIAIAEVMTREVITLLESEFQDLFQVLSLMQKHCIRHLPIVSQQGQVLGMLSHGSIRKVLQPVNLLKARSVLEVMIRGVVTAPPTASLLSLAELMSRHKVSCVVITQMPDTLNPNLPEGSVQGVPISPPKSDPQAENFREIRALAVGMVTERDLVQFHALDLDLNNTSAAMVMSQPLFSLKPHDSLWNAHQIMKQWSVRRLVVVSEQGELLGIVTQSTLLQAFDPMEMYRVIEILQQSVEEQLVELTETNELLQKEILERQQAQEELNRALAQEKELNELKSSFTSMVTHEFRNPLTSILCASQLLERFADKITEEQRFNYLQMIQRTAEYMEQMINDLLVLGRVENRQLEYEPQPLDLVTLCQDLVEERQFSDIENHSIIFQAVGATQDACLDEKLLRYILGNLLTNACKYSPSTSPIYFDLICQDNQAIFKIRDSGIGIPVEDRKRLFQSFHRARNVGTIPGTGLGLTIVKNCVEAHHGEIAVESEVNVGTTFTVTLPLTPESAGDLRENAEGSWVDYG